MSRYNDYTGISYTCPLIDEIIDAINQVDWEKIDSPFYLTGLDGTLEQIRAMNGELRDFGNEHFKASEEWEKEHDEQKAINHDLEQEIENLKNYVSEIENTLSKCTT